MTFSGQCLCAHCNNVLCDGPAAPPTGAVALSHFDALSPDEIESIARFMGSSLPAFASTSRHMRQAVQPAMWRQAYEETKGVDATEYGDDLSASLWRACLSKDARSS